MDKDDLIALTLVIARQQRAIMVLEAQLIEAQKKDDPKDG